MTYKQDIRLLAIINDTLLKHRSRCLDDDADMLEVCTALTNRLRGELTHRTVNDWADEVHVLAVEKGWWRDESVTNDNTISLDLALVKNTVPVKLNLIHDEVSEASAEGRQDLWDIYWNIPDLGRVELKQITRWAFDAHAVKEPFAVSQLSALMRIVGYPAPDMFPDLLTKLSRDLFIAEMLDLISQKFKPEGFGIEVIDGIIRSLDLLKALDLNAEALMLMKHTYNKGRPYRHGGKRF